VTRGVIVHFVYPLLALQRGCAELNLFKRAHSMSGEWAIEW